MVEKTRMARTKKLLGPADSGSKPDKARTTFYLDKKVYKRFQALCSRKGRTTSEVIEAIMADLLEELPEQEKIAPKRR